MTVCISVGIPESISAPCNTTALANVLAQTCRPWEVLKVDVAPHDDPTQIVERLAVRAPVPLQLWRLATNDGSPSRPMSIASARRVHRGAKSGRYEFPGETCP